MWVGRTREIEGTQTFHRRPRWFVPSLMGLVEKRMRMRMMIQGRVGWGRMLPLRKRKRKEGRVR